MTVGSAMSPGSTRLKTAMRVLAVGAGIGGNKELKEHDVAPGGVGFQVSVEAMARDEHKHAEPDCLDDIAGESDVDACGDGGKGEGVSSMISIHIHKASCYYNYPIKQFSG